MASPTQEFEKAAECLTRHQVRLDEAAARLSDFGSRLRDAAEASGQLVVVKEAEQYLVGQTGTLIDATTAVMTDLLEVAMRLSRAKESLYEELLGGG